MKTFELAARKELRFLVPDKALKVDFGKVTKQVHLKLIKGNAEIFGVNLRINEEHELSSGSYALYTWYGCTVELNMDLCSKAYEESDNLQELYSAIHGNLELLRAKEIHKEKGGPRIAVVGSEGVGKTTVAKTLAAYCARCEELDVKGEDSANRSSKAYGPVFVDLDVKSNSLSLPGCISALPDFKTGNLRAGEGLMNKGSLTYFVGHDSPSKVPELFGAAVEQLANAVQKRLASSNGTRNSGAIIDTFALGIGSITEETEYKLLRHALQAFKVDIVLVLGLDRLASDLKVDLDAVTSGTADPSGIHILKIPISGAAVKKSEAQRKAEQSRAFKRYFEGSKTLALIPHRETFLLKVPKSEEEDEVEIPSTVQKKEVTLWKIQDKVFANEALLPVGEEATVRPSNASQVLELSADLVNQVLGISYSTDEEEIKFINPMRNVAGFAYIESVEVETNKLTLLLPSPFDLPSYNMLLGSMMWTEL